jgi:uncharacterized Zn finger protein
MYSRALLNFRKYGEAPAFGESLKVTSNNMSKKKPLDRFSDLTWDDLEEWAGSRIVGRGRSYQKKGRVADLNVTENGTLVARVSGSKRYTTRVDMDKKGLPESLCTCPYEYDCKHGVAVVLEYLERVKKNRPVPRADKNDERFSLVGDENWEKQDEDEGTAASVNIQKEINTFLKDKTKTQLIKLINELAEQFPGMAQTLADRKQLTSGDTKALVTRLRREIREIGDEEGWQNYWEGEGHTPDYSGIRIKLEALVKSGHTDEVLSLGKELIQCGTRQVEESHDEGETGMEVAACLPAVIKALDQSSLSAADKLAWAVDVLLKDQYELCEDFAEYLHRKHPKAAWHALADQLLAQLNRIMPAKGADNFSSNYERDHRSDWIIHALEQAGRTEEVIPLCEAEARMTGSYDRLVKHLMAARLYEDAERWIQEGVRVTSAKYPGIASGLREKLRDIRMRQKNWPVVAAMQAEEFVRRPSWNSFLDCQKAADKAKAWPQMRGHLLHYLETGKLPWSQEGWPLIDSGQDPPEPDRRERFPRIDDLIEIAINEKKPDQVLRWYDQLPKDHFGWYGIEEDKVATSIQSDAPDRAVAIWKKRAERLIAQVKPRAYQEAARYLRKAAKVMISEKKQTEWEHYLKGLREKHIRKHRLIETLDGLEGKPIVKTRR